MKQPDPFASLAVLVEDLSERDPGGRALRGAGRVLGRGALAASARVLATGWAAQGFRPGDVVAIVGDGGMAFAQAFLSAARAGLAPLLLDPRIPDDEARAVLAVARPKALALCEGATVPFAEGLALFRFDGEGCASLVRPGAPPPLRGDPAAPAALLVTSGTSGRPRVVALTADNLSSNIRSGCLAHPCEREDVFLSLLPVTHAFELTTGFLGPLRCGASIAYAGKLNPHRLLGLAISEGVTKVNVVPAFLRMMADEIREDDAGQQILTELRARMRSIVCGGAAVSPKLVERVVRAGLPLWLGYGLTEASPIVALGRADQLPSGCTGRVLPGVEVRIDGATDQVLVRGPNVMAGYVGDPEATAIAVRNGWLHTGDCGRVEGEHLFIHGRIKDLIVTAAGQKLFPQDIETAYASPLFAEVCALGVPDPRAGGGERPHLVVVPAPDAPTDEAGLRAEFLRLSAAAGSRRAFAMTVLHAPLPRTRSLKLRRDLVRGAVLAAARSPA